MIANLTTVRPYAKAIFVLALRNQQFSEWQNTLNLLALIANEYKKKLLLNSQGVRHKQGLSFFYDASKNFPAATNLVHILAERKKLGMLPDIAIGYQQLLFEHKKMLEAKIVTTRELASVQKEQLIKALQRRYQRHILPQYQIDDKLIGGVVIYIAGQVIDGSIKGKLQRLKQSLFF